MSSNVAAKIQQLKEQEMERYRDLFHTMFKKVLDKIKADVHYQLPRGIYHSSIRLPSVPAFSGFTMKPTPPQEEVDTYIIRQLEKRSFIVTKQDAHYIRVDWSSLVSLSERDTSLSEMTEEKRNKDNTIALLPKTDGPMLLPPIRKTLPPVRAATPAAPSTAPSLPSKSKMDCKTIAKGMNQKIVSKNVPILSNKVPRLNSQIEKKMAASHQSVLRALAGV